MFILFSLECQGTKLEMVKVIGSLPTHLGNVFAMQRGRILHGNMAAACRPVASTKSVINKDWVLVYTPPKLPIRLIK